MATGEMRALLAAGDAAAAWALFDSMQAHDAEALFLGSRAARALWRQEAREEATEWLHRACNLAEAATAALRGRYRLLHVEVWFHRLRLETERGDTWQSLQAANWLLSHGRKAAGDKWRFAEPEVHLLAGLAYARRSESLLALAHYGQAVEAATREGQHGIRVRALHNAAWLCCRDRNPDRAETFLQEAEGLLSGQVDVWHQALRWAFVDFLRGDFDGALRQLQVVYDEANPPPDEPVTRDGAEVLAWASWLAGRICLSIGLLGEAGDFCRNGHGWALQGGDTRVMTDLCRLEDDIRRAQASASD